MCSIVHRTTVPMLSSTTMFMFRLWINDKEGLGNAHIISPYSKSPPRTVCSLHLILSTSPVPAYRNRAAHGMQARERAFIRSPDRSVAWSGEVFRLFRLASNGGKALSRGIPSTVLQCCKSLIHQKSWLGPRNSHSSVLIDQNCSRWQ